MRAPIRPPALACLLAAGLVLGAAAPAAEARGRGKAARAQEPGAPAAAVQRYKIGLKLYRKGRYAEAAAEFETAEAMFPASAKLVFNRARALERAGDVAGAVTAYETYLARAPEAADRAEVEQLLGVLRVRRDALRPTLTLASTPPGARVFLDDSTEAAGTTPLKLKVPPGGHVLRFELDGHTTATRQVDAAEKQTVAVSVELAPEPESEPEPTPEPKPPAEAAAAAPPAPVPPPAPEAAPVGWPRAAAWASLGAAGLALAAGAWFHASALDTAEEAAALGPAPADLARRDALRSGFDGQSAGMWVGYGAAAALAVTGAVLLLASGEDSGAAAWRPFFGGGAVAVGF